MTRALAILALHAASKATQRAYETLRAIGSHTAAAHVRQAGELVQSALVLIAVDRGAYQESVS